MSFQFEGFKHGEKTPYDHLFKDIKHLSHTEGDGGLKLIATVENGNVLLDFGGPVQALGMTGGEAKAIVVMLMEALMVAEMKGAVKKSEAN